MRYDFLIPKLKTLIEIPWNSHSIHFSALMSGKRIVSLGNNAKRKTHPLCLKYGTRFAAIHSELDCILHFPYTPQFLKEFTLVNLRFLRNGNVAIAKPCTSCQKLLRDFGISEVYYTDYNRGFSKLCQK